MNDNENGLYIAVIGVDVSGKTYALTHQLVNDFALLGNTVYNGWKVVTELNDDHGFKSILKESIENRDFGDEYTDLWIQQYRLNALNVKSLLNDNKLVVSDRLWTDGYVYQGIPFSDLTGVIIPDYVFWLDTDLHVIEKRLEDLPKRNERFENLDDIKYHHSRMFEVFEWLSDFTTTVRVQKPHDISNYLRVELINGDD